MTHHRRIAVALALVLPLLGVACGDDERAGETGAAARTVAVEMRDVAFSPTSVRVERGETIRFVFENVGEQVHEAYIGDARAQAKHAEDMASDDGHGHGGDDDAVTVEPGERGELTHTFDEPGTVEIGCHEPGHYESGMKLVVEVA